jgi:5-methyltetrahydrofolate--homocysteine methyltransferase
MRIGIKDLTSSYCRVADGGWGTEFQKIGLELRSSPDHWNLFHPEKVSRIARSYVDAGADIILTNTFGGNRFALARHNLEDRLEEVNRRGAEISRAAAGDQALVFGSMGPTGKRLQTGEVTEQAALDSYRRQAEALWRGGVDALLIETMVDVVEMKIAARAARESTPLPVVLSMSFDSGEERTQTLMGVSPEQAVVEMEEAGAWMVGANCGLGPELYVRVCSRMRAVTSRPIWVKASAGIPQRVGAEIVYPHSPDTFASFALRLREAGANVIGGCCGTGPDHIRKLVALLASHSSIRKQ